MELTKCVPFDEPLTQIIDAHPLVDLGFQCSKKLFRRLQSVNRIDKTAKDMRT